MPQQKSVKSYWRNRRRLIINETVAGLFTTVSYFLLQYNLKNKILYRENIFVDAGDERLIKSSATSRTDEPRNFIY